jgi:acyl dehydratase
MTTTTVERLDEFHGLVGRQIGYSEWQTITQERVNLFADATDDHQWIHVDPEAAKAGPFGGPIAHGYLTLSLGPVLLQKILDIPGMTYGINYGANKVRFPSPVPVGAELRMGVTVASAEDVGGGVQVVFDLVFELKDAPKPACVAQVVYRYFS